MILIPCSLPACGSLECSGSCQMFFSTPFAQYPIRSVFSFCRVTYSFAQSPCRSGKTYFLNMYLTMSLPLGQEESNLFDQSELILSYGDIGFKRTNMVAGFPEYWG
jgi:hypothetical protein